MDGTLIDSVPAHARAFVEALRPDHPGMLENFNYEIYAGWPTRAVFAALGFRDEKEVTALTERKQRLYREAVARGEVVVFPGAISLLDQLQNEGRFLFLVTGASRISTQLILEGAGLITYFQGITTADDVHPGKPSPEPYLQTLAQFHLKPEDCLAVEDSESGVGSAIGAGLETVLIHADFSLPGVISVKNCDDLALLLLQ